MTGATTDGSRVRERSRCRRDLPTCLGLVAGIALATLTTPCAGPGPAEGLQDAAPAAPVLLGAAQIAGLDRCAEVWVRPDRDLANARTCTLRRGPGVIARRGGVALFGSYLDVSRSLHPVPLERDCWGPLTHASNAAYIDRIRAERRPGDPPLAFVHLHRFDLVAAPQAALPGFDAHFLVRTKRPWAQVLGFFSGDRGPLCRSGPCRLSTAYTANPARDPDPSLSELIDRSGGSGSHESVVYYLSHAAPGRRVHWIQAALADLRNPSYRAWRVAEARRVLAVGGFDAVELNHKFGQYRDPSGYWIGGQKARDVESLNDTGTTYWTAPPDGYGYGDYVRGWAALGRDLRAAGVPYEVELSGAMWAPRDPMDDPRTPAVNEAELIRATARGASLVRLSHVANRELLVPIEQDLRAGGARLVLSGAARNNACP